MYYSKNSYSRRTNVFIISWISRGNKTHNGNLYILILKFHLKREIYFMRMLLKNVQFIWYLTKNIFKYITIASKFLYDKLYLFISKFINLKDILIWI